MIIDPFIVFIIPPGLTPLGIHGPNTTIQIQDTCKFLCTFTDSPSMVLNFLVHILGVGLFFDATDHLRLGIGLVFEGLLLGVLLFGCGTVSALLVGFLVLGVVDDLIGGNFNLFEDLLFIGLGLYFYCLVYHIAKLVVSLIQFLIPLD
jgi:hypothetical protein